MWTDNELRLNFALALMAAGDGGRAAEMARSVVDDNPSIFQVRAHFPQFG